MVYDFLNIYNKLNFLEYPLRLQYSNFIYKHITPRNSLRKIIKRIKRHEPIEYIFQSAEFCNYNFFVNKNVLIPRKETEKIVEIAIDLLNKLDIDTVIDVGTGSGCIIISIANLMHKKTKKIKYIGIDICQQALKVAYKNLKRFKLESEIELVKMDFKNFNFNNPQNKKVLLCANLPYIPKKTILPKSVAKYEPKIAIYGKGKKGDLLIKKIIKIYKKNDNIKGIIWEKNNGIIKYLLKS